MIEITRRKSLFVVLLGLAGLATTTGCQTSRSEREALVCPGCRTIVETRNRGYENYGYAFPQEVARHECSGCQGALTTLLTEGRLKHTCSRCDGTPFTCPVGHR